MVHGSPVVRPFCSALCENVTVAHNGAARISPLLSIAICHAWIGSVCRFTFGAYSCREVFGEVHLVGVGFDKTSIFLNEVVGVVVPVPTQALNVAFVLGVQGDNNICACIPDQCHSTR